MLTPSSLPPLLPPHTTRTQNFNSPHTHDYCNIGGDPAPVDSCVKGCRAGGSLPTCSAPTPYFNGGAGTIMSYCHLLRGGDNNVALTFGMG